MACPGDPDAYRALFAARHRRIAQPQATYVSPAVRIPVGVRGKPFLVVTIPEAERSKKGRAVFAVDALATNPESGRQFWKQMAAFTVETKHETLASDGSVDEAADYPEWFAVPLAPREFLGTSARLRVAADHDLTFGVELRT